MNLKTAPSLKGFDWMISCGFIAANHPVEVLRNPLTMLKSKDFYPKEIYL